MYVNPFAKYDQEILNVIQNLRILDDDFMVKIFEDQDCLELVLRIIMDVPTLKIKDFKPQSTIKNLQGKSVRFDVWAVDINGTQYDIEVQRSDKGAGKERARYYLSMLDANITIAGDAYEQLPETYVIFITEHDALKGGQLCYHIDRTVRETGEPFNDRTHIIYVNAAYDDVSSELGKLMADFRETDPDKMRFDSLKQRSKYFKQAPEGVGTMCRAVEELQAKAAADSMMNTAATMIRAGLVSLEAAAAQLNISADELRSWMEQNPRVDKESI